MPAAARRATQVREHLLGRLAPVVEATGHDLEDVTVAEAGRRSVVRVVVDADGGVDLDAVAVISRAVSEALDDETDGGAAFAGPYVLEVSSPGVDRPLTLPRHWRRAVGRLVAVDVDGVARSGRVTAASDAGITLDDDDAVAWSALGRGRVQIEFNRPGSSSDSGPNDESDDESDDEPVDDVGEG